MPTDKSFRSVQGQGTPATKGAEYQVKRYAAPEMAETRKAPPSQARSPAPQHLGATRGIGAGGAKVSERVNTSAHSRAWGLKGS
jgi:hypothetical protein